MTRRWKSCVQQSTGRELSCSRDVGREPGEWGWRLKREVTSVASAFAEDEVSRPCSLPALLPCLQLLPNRAHNDGPFALLLQPQAFLYIALLLRSSRTVGTIACHFARSCRSVEWPALQICNPAIHHPSSGTSNTSSNAGRNEHAQYDQFQWDTISARNVEDRF